MAGLRELVSFNRLGDFWDILREVDPGAVERVLSISSADVYGIVSPFRSTFGFVATSFSYKSTFSAYDPAAVLPKRSSPLLCTAGRFNRHDFFRLRRQSQLRFHPHQWFREQATSLRP
jgi:hypothetical protein